MIYRIQWEVIQTAIRLISTAHPEIEPPIQELPPTITRLLPMEVRISRRQVVAIRCRRGRRSRRAQLTTLLLVTTVNTPYPTSPVISCFQPMCDAMIPLRAIRRRPLPLQPGRFCAVLPPPSTPTGPASTNNHPQCHTRTGSSPRSSRSLIQPKLTRSRCLAEKSRSRSQR